MKYLKIITVLVALAATSSLFGAIIVYDGFDAPLGTSITNTTGGIGWADATWICSYAWNTELDASNSEVVPGLTYNDGSVELKTGGNAILIEPIDNGLTKDTKSNVWLHMHWSLPVPPGKVT